ncbi:MAG: InlB B-repeat-containing protein, partial [Kosmotogaceae bacterium]
LKFHVYFGTNGNIKQEQSNLTEKYYEMDNLDQEDTYYWFIVAEDEHSAKATSDTYSFIYDITQKNNLNLNIIGEGKVFIEINNETISTEESTTISHEAATVTLTPKSISNNYIFGNWDIDKNHDIIADDVAIFYLDEDVNATATFKLKEYDITLSASPEDGGVVSDDGIFEHGQEVTVVATPNEGYEFSSWTDSEDDTVLSTNTAYTFNATEDKHLFANFDKKTYILTIDKIGEGETEPATGIYGEENEEPWTETLIATPTGDYEFKHWKLSTGETIEATTTEIEINEDITATAVFKLPEFEITASASPAEGGIVSGGGSYELGSDVTLVATPNENWRFDAWYEDDSVISTETSFTFKATEDRFLVAHFKNTLLTIDSTPLSEIPILVNGNEVMTPYSTSVNSGDSIEITASPTLMLNLINEQNFDDLTNFGSQNDASLTFLGWSDNIASNTRLFDSKTAGQYTIKYYTEYLLKTEKFPHLAVVDNSNPNIYYPEYHWYEHGDIVTLKVPYETVTEYSGDELTFALWKVNDITFLNEVQEEYVSIEIEFNEPKFILAKYNSCK